MNNYSYIIRFIRSLRLGQNGYCQQSEKYTK